MLLESKEFTQNERIKFAQSIPSFSIEEEERLNPVKTSEFKDKDSTEEYHITLDDNDLQGFSKGTSTIDFDSNFRSQEKMTAMFRQMSLDPIVDQCITNITDDAMSFNFSPDSNPMKMIIDQEKLNKQGLSDEEFENKILDCYNNVLSLLDFRERGYEYFRQWYIDGKIFFELVFEVGEKVIKSVNLLSPYNIMKVKVKDEYYYLYDETKEQEILRRNMTEDDGYLDDLKLHVVDYNKKANNKDDVKLIPEKYVIAVESGIKPFGYPLSPLYYARKSLNQLQLLEDAMVVYRIARAPERRVISVGVGKMRPTQVKQVMSNVAKEFKQKLVMDHNTGNVLDHRHVAATTEDYYLPVYDNGQSTKIDTLKGGEQLGKIQDIEYQLMKLIRAMKNPLSRFGLGENSLVDMGSDSKVERDEMNFSKYCKRLRQQFEKLIWSLMSRQMQCKKIIKYPSEFEDIKLALHLRYEGDNHYEELHRIDIYQKKTSLFQMLEPVIDSGRFSELQVYRDVMGMSHDAVEEMYSERTESVTMKRQWLDINFEELKRIAEMEGDLALLQNPELQIQLKQIEQDADFTKEKYGDDYTSGGK